MNNFYRRCVLKCHIHISFTVSLLEQLPLGLCLPLFLLIFGLLVRTALLDFLEHFPIEIVVGDEHLLCYLVNLWIPMGLRSPVCIYQTLYYQGIRLLHICLYNFLN